MAAVRRLRTQTEAFWRDEYVVNDQDIDLVTTVILDAGKPQPLSVLTSSVILRRVRQEREAVARQAASGEVYQPRNRYEVGERLVFTTRDMAVGEVVAKRDGRNPKYPPFEVLRVAFEDGTEREYASNLDVQHPLNRPAEEILGGGDPDMSDADIVSAFDAYVEGALHDALARREEFVEFDEHWFLQELLPEINVGHLNLAEAAIDVAGHPLPAREIVNQLDLGGGAAGSQLFALNAALTRDERFDNVGPGDEPIWYLKALEPEAIHNPPELLEGGIAAAGGEYIGLTMLDLVEEIGDELDDVQSAVLREPDQLGFRVIFPHLISGTMPATIDLMRKLPPISQHHVALEFTDAQTGERFQAWLVPDRSYICGLGPWYKAVNMQVGGIVTLTPGDAPLSFTISSPRSRERGGTFVRTAQMSDGEVTLGQTRRPSGVINQAQVDGDMFVYIPKPEEIAQAMLRPENQRMSIGEVVRLAFLQLAGLTGQGYVHAKAVYAVCNLIRRTGAVPVFAELTRQACFDPIDQLGMWAYDHALEGTVYTTPDEMRERPESQRDNVIRDQAVPYTGR